MNRSAKFIRPEDFPGGQFRYGILCPPFRSFTGKKQGGHPVTELVMGFLFDTDFNPNRVAIRTANGLYEFNHGESGPDCIPFSAPYRDHVRPWSLKIGGQGWIRIERQLGTDVLDWPFRMLALKAGTSTHGSYVEVVEFLSTERSQLFGVMA